MIRNQKFNKRYIEIELERLNAALCTERNTREI